MFRLVKAVYTSLLSRLESSTHRISKEIGEAASKGDLKENAEYHAAREKLGFQEAVISRLRSDLAEEVPTVTDDGKDRVHVHDLVQLASNDANQYMVLCQKLDTKIIELMQDATLLDDDIEFEPVTIGSPLGTALLGASKKDKVHGRTVMTIQHDYFDDHPLNTEDEDLMEEILAEIMFDLGVDNPE